MSIIMCFLDYILRKCYFTTHLCEHVFFVNHWNIFAAITFHIFNGQRTLRKCIACNIKLIYCLLLAAASSLCHAWLCHMTFELWSESKKGQLCIWWWTFGSSLEAFQWELTKLWQFDIRLMCRNRRMDNRTSTVCNTRPSIPGLVSLGIQV